MSTALHTTIDRELNRWTRSDAPDGTRRVSFDTPHGRVTCALSDVNSLACALHGLRLHSPRLDDLTAERMREIAGQLEQRVTYLLEPLQLIELDEAGTTAQLRSTKPRQDETARVYYELEVRPGELSIQRFRKLPRQPRENTPMTLTREVLIRLAADLDAVCG